MRRLLRPTINMIRGPKKKGGQDNVEASTDFINIFKDKTDPVSILSRNLKKSLNIPLSL